MSNKEFILKIIYGLCILVIVGIGFGSMVMITKINAQRDILIHSIDCDISDDNIYTIPDNEYYDEVPVPEPLEKEGIKI